MSFASETVFFLWFVVALALPRTVLFLLALWGAPVDARPVIIRALIPGRGNTGSNDPKEVGSPAVPELARPLPVGLSCTHDGSEAEGSIPATPETSQPS